ncbi:MAG: ATP-dependent sacrificial sulfur transferase LarE [Candidatus Heimdallarchaeota archaeon]|nr:ATP-dependent sacrificial sulfur transferase LarE [Candidatus Heimdallarchaeota archaeon]
MSINLEITDENKILNKTLIVKELLNGKKVVVAFSGGVDSSVVAFLAREYAAETLLVMQTGSSVPKSEVDIARNQASQLGLQIRFIDYNEVDYSAEYALNDENRCYHCKSLLYNFISKIKQEINYDYILSGTNISDLKGHRPGHQASMENEVLNPLVLAKMNKSEVRFIALMNELLTAEKPATACLASRIITGVPITIANLSRIDKAEYMLKRKFNLSILRVRDHGDLARIEVGKDELEKIMGDDSREFIYSELKKLGYHYVSLDLQAYRPAVPLGYAD